jgi:hypothetical protein
MSTSPYPRYYAVNDRPVKVVRCPDGGSDILVLDWSTGTFVPDRTYWEKISSTGIGKDVDQLTEAAFETRVAVVRASVVAKYADSPITWEDTGDAVTPYRAHVANHTFTIRINDFPDEPLYSLLIDGQDIADLEDWPAAWTQPDIPKSLLDSIPKAR